MDVLKDSSALKEAHIWHKVQNAAIATRRTCVETPDIDCKVAYARIAMIDGNSLTSSGNIAVIGKPLNPS